ncbi:MAG TPA: hypothetical protein GXX40_06960 [Firmicutes bacterium]|nr:hypothetical protein [Bacillota bacterium]
MAEGKGIVVLTPSESKRLIAKAVAAMPEVKSALSTGRVVIGHGGTNSFVAEEILGSKVETWRYIAGYVGKGQLKVTPRQNRLDPFVLVRGQPVKMSLEEALSQFEGGDVFVKGANAVDPEGRVGILMTDPMSGTIGKALPYLAARGSQLIVPVGLEKLVPDVIAAARVCGQRTFNCGIAPGVGLMPLVAANVVTEIRALQILFGVRATHVASGGIDGGEGSVVLVVEGEASKVTQAMEMLKSIKGEPPIRGTEG